MVFSTPSCAKSADLPCRRLGLALLLLAACSQPESDFGFTIERVEAHTIAGVLMVEVQQEIVLSPEAKEALKHGVPLAIRTELALRAAGSRHDLDEETRNFEIRYLPLSNRYQLTTAVPHGVQTYPRLRHALADINTVNFRLSMAGLPAGDLELRARSRLDKTHMPPPMRLPAWFSSQWQHDSGWYSQPFNVRSRT